jgi:hypothetical protein
MEDRHNLGWIPGKRYRIWTGDIDLVLRYKDGWVIVQDEKTGEIRAHLTRCNSEPLD